MKFRLGDRVRIIPSEQRFYIGMYNLTTFIGFVLKEHKGCIYVDFNNSRAVVPILNQDLELIKNQQLLFDFYTE